MAGLEEPKQPKEKGSAAGTVAIILAAGVAVGLIIITSAILLAAWARLGVDPDSGISENGTQLLTAIFSGVIGALSAYLGFSLKERREQKKIENEKPPEEPLP
jgi:hypothetical protein